jgi:ribonuclease D
VKRPRTTEELGAVQGLQSRARAAGGQELLDRIAASRAAGQRARPLSAPSAQRTRDGRRPDVDERAERLKEIRNKRADELAIDRGTLLPNAVVLEIARREPRTPEELAEVPGLRRWQASVLAEPMLAALGKKKAASR